MPKPISTRTLNPLPFGDLEPKRFEDLVRALAYDFRKWRMLEATGRSGADRGFDGRGYEIVDSLPDTVVEVNGDEAQLIDSDRLWLIQCKREKAIGSEKAKKHLAEIVISEDDDVYGMIFAAACDFSITTRDTIRSWGRSEGMSEIHIWGKGELEDQLRQPKNDHILFAFFGISMQIRKRSVQSELRSFLATKRKCVRLLKDHKSHFILLRDPTDKRYPKFPETEEEDSQGDVRWFVVKYSEIIHRGVVLSTTRYFAYIGNDGESWDIIDTDNLSAPFESGNWWHVDGEGRGRGRNYWSIWNDLPHANKADYCVDRIIPFEIIIDIDEHGDQYAKFPHIYIEDIKLTEKVSYIERGGGFSREHFKCDPEKRIDFSRH